MYSYLPQNMEGREGGRRREGGKKSKQAKKQLEPKHMAMPLQTILETPSFIIAFSVQLVGWY